jgi:hypothetical protein
MKTKIQFIASKIFGQDKAECAIQCLQDFEASFGQSHSDESGRVSERIEAAILKLSESKKDEFENHIKLAKIDWRDVLVGAGFGKDARIHLKWIKEKIESAA